MQRLRRTWISVSAMALFVMVVQASSQQVVPPAGVQADKAVDYAADIQPILSKSCYGCHAGAQPQAGLRLDVRSLALKGNTAGPIIIPGNSADSKLVHRVRGLGGLRTMPLLGAPLTPAQIDVLTRWIDAGASWPDAMANEEHSTIEKHWAYAVPVRPPVPAVKASAWVRNPIDNFILGRLEKEGLAPSHEASRETLIRRLSLDLIGLPPTPAEVDAFLADTRPDAYERLVDRLLASPHHGERAALPWLDLARYGDSNGIEKDSRRMGAWRYRDWVIKAFNANMPFNQFVIEQLAGDLLPNATLDQKIATGFVRSSLYSDEGGTDPEEQDWIGQVDRANAVGTALLGSTLGCAQCHNHKYDPFLQKDFYAMVAFFNNARFDPTATTLTGGRGGKFTEATIEFATPEQAAKRDALNAEIKAVQEEIRAFPKSFELWQAWERSIVEAEKQWQPLGPTGAHATTGSALSIEQDGSVFASGPVPESDTYVVETTSPFTGSLTAVQIEALPDPRLPNGRNKNLSTGGPGRDYYGDFSVNRVDVEIGSGAGRFTKAVPRQTVFPVATDEPPVPGNTFGANFTDGADYKIPEMWRSDVQRDGATRRARKLIVQLERPVAVKQGDPLRISVVNYSDLTKQLLGRFRLLVSSAPDPYRVVEMPSNLRPLLATSWEQRPKPQATGRGNGAFAGAGAAFNRTDSALAEAAKAAPYETDQVFAYWRRVAPELASLRDKVAGLQMQLDKVGITVTPVLAENTEVSHPKTTIRLRGVYVDKAEEVSAAVPGFLGALPNDGPQNRLGLARWLVGPENPLTARVRVNQIWQMVYGRGLVETSEDFGTHGSVPSHPELLDWLATEFVAKGWDQKAFLRLIVTSNTYRQTAAVTPALLEQDPNNELLARGPRFRVDAETVRDITLAVSGLLTPKVGGPSVMPPQPDGTWSLPFLTPDDKWVAAPVGSDDRYRRGLYTFIRRAVFYPSHEVFDASPRMVSMPRRPRSNTPLQALTTFNDPAFFEASQALARRLVKEGGPDVASRATYGFRLATSRKPKTEELTTLTAAFEKARTRFQGNPREASAWAGAPDADLAAWAVVSSGLLNLDETLTKE